ncbi:MAG: hypothetical protein NXH71_04080 [Erythrobacteraceae bacterium]|jgi:hypothetical protein|nr:hypothetical protein [Erythrobacteraceae bacterium]
MTDPKEPVRIEDENARAARTPGTLRYILGISLALAIIAMSLVWIVPALTR